MARFGDAGPYAVGNVKIITNAENLAERKAWSDTKRLEFGERRSQQFASEEHRQKMSRAQKLRWQNPTQKMLASQRSKWDDAARRERQAARMRALWAQRRAAKAEGVGL
jgi:hypothetical protein